MSYDRCAKKVSIIIPVYNAVRYVAETIGSLLKQTYRNLELIAVDDGSTDGSSELLDRLAKEDSRLRVFHKPNGGVSSARNYGLEHFTGDYVWFFDADDILHEQAVEIMLKACEENGAPFAYTPVERFSNADAEALRTRKFAYTYENLPCATDAYRCFKNNFYGVQHFLCRADYLQGLQFDCSIKYGEDMLFSYGILLREPKAVYIHTPLVFYRQHETSACATLTKEAIRGDIEKVASRFVEILRRDNVPEKIRYMLTTWIKNHDISECPPKPDKRKCYALMADDETRKTSSSGGAFPVLAREILKRGGCVVGAAVQSDFSVAYEIAEDEETLKRQFGSKYVQCRFTSNVFKGIGSRIKSGKPVFFAGTACHVAGIRKAYPNAENLYTMDLICHGAPRAEFWQKYLGEVSAGRQPVSVSFRKKDPDWGPDHKLTIDFSDGSHFEEVGHRNVWIRAFLGDLSLSEGCSKCPYHGTERPADITCGDFWELRQDPVNDRKGISCVITNTEKGEALLGMLKGGETRLIPSDLNIIIQPNFFGATRPHPLAKEFQADVLSGRMCFTEAVNYYLEHPKAVAILNFHWENRNFGAVLTSFALSRFLSDNGWYPQNIDYSPREADTLAMRLNPPFEEFRKHYIPRTNAISRLEKIKWQTRLFRNFIVGSDQVWSDYLTKGKEETFFLSFVGAGKRLIAAAASFGMVSAEERDREELKLRLSVFDTISVREANDAEFVNREIAPCVCVCDPVFWLGAEFWRKFIGGRPAEKKGVVVYTVSPDSNAKLLEFMVKASVSDLEHPAQFIQSTLSPIGWLKAIAEAELVVTDSFHASCFAAILHTEFVVIHDNGNSTSRLRTMLSGLGLENHLFATAEAAAEAFNAHRPSSNWIRVDERLKAYAAEGSSFMKAALEKDLQDGPDRLRLWQELKLWQAHRTISVIIPVYNAEKYLRACLDSVLNQVGFSVEVICVDDGSTDDSPAILREYAARDPRVTVLTQTNQGPGVARNAGLAVAKGEYVMFLDADDRLTSGRNLGTAFDYAKSNRLDVLVLSSNKLLNEGGGSLDGGSLRREMIPSEKVFTPEAVGINLFVFTVQVPWAKLYRREFITTHGLNFPALTRSEDFPFVMSSLLKAKAIGILDIPLCDHRIGVETSLESTKDETPCIFLDAADWFCKSVDMPHQPEWVKRAFRVSMVCRYAYNLKAIRCYSGFKQIVARLMQETGESLRLIEGYQNPIYLNAYDLLERVQKVHHNDSALVDLFVEIHAKSSAIAAAAQIKTLQARIGELEAQNGEHWRRRKEFWSRIEAQSAQIKSLQAQDGEHWRKRKEFWGRIEAQSAQIKSLQARIGELQKQNAEMRQSVAYRLGRFITEPWRWIRSAVKR